MGKWDIGIFDCGKNPIMFVWACCVPCGGVCMQAYDAKLTDSDKNACLIAALLSCCCGAIGAIVNRYRLREHLKIKDSIIMDILFTCCLPCCSVTQEYITVVKEKKGDEKTPIWKVWSD